MRSIPVPLVVGIPVTPRRGRVMVVGPILCRLGCHDFGSLVSSLPVMVAAACCPLDTLLELRARAGGARARVPARAHPQAVPDKDTWDWDQPSSQMPRCFCPVPRGARTCLRLSREGERPLQAPLPFCFITDPFSGR